MPRTRDRRAGRAARRHAGVRRVVGQVRHDHGHGHAAGPRRGAGRGRRARRPGAGAVEAGRRGRPVVLAEPPRRLRVDRRRRRPGDAAVESVPAMRLLELCRRLARRPARHPRACLANERHVGRRKECMDPVLDGLERAISLSAAASAFHQLLLAAAANEETLATRHRRLLRQQDLPVSRRWQTGRSQRVLGRGEYSCPRCKTCRGRKQQRPTDCTRDHAIV